MKRLEIHPGFVMLACFLFYVSPLGFFLPFFTLSILHELGHIAALTIFGVEIRRIRLGGFGAELETGPMSPSSEAVCALAGPAVNLCCVWTLRRISLRLAMLSLLLGCYNLLPVYPLDGGRALRAVVALLLPPEAARRTELCVEILCIGAVGYLCLRLGLRFGLAPLGLFAVLLVHLARERNTCCDFCPGTI